MKKEKVVVVDYGLGNLFSVKRALEHCGATNVQISSTVDDINTADKLILPGVGAYQNGMHGLIERGLVEPIRNYANSNKPILGICLGMQLLATCSEEFGNHAGLNLIPGKIIRIPNVTKGLKNRKIPFIGWASLKIKKREIDDKTNAFDLNGHSFYLVHSYYYVPEDDENIVATYDYQGEEITAAVTYKNIYGFQFHPEKSGNAGLNLLKSFVRMNKQ